MSHDAYSAADQILPSLGSFEPSVWGLPGDSSDVPLT